MEVKQVDDRCLKTTCEVVEKCHADKALRQYVGDRVLAVRVGDVSLEYGAARRRVPDTLTPQKHSHEKLKSRRFK
jgi:hypothetical protein